MVNELVHPTIMKAINIVNNTSAFLNGNDVSMYRSMVQKLREGYFGHDDRVLLVDGNH